MTLLLANGTVYDPANGIDGEVRSLWIDGGKIVAPPSDPHARADRVIDLTGLVVMPGGIDMHAHIAGPKVNFARKMRPEDKRFAPPMRKTARTRSGTLGSVPSTFATGYLYAGMGYTTVFDAAIPPIGARHTHEEFHDTPVIDKGFLTLLGNHLFALQQIANGEFDRLRDFTGWLLHAVKGYGIKVVNPGGVEAWKHGGDQSTGLDEPCPPFGVTPRQIVQAIAQAVMDLGLPHALHLHCNQLGLPGNWTTTLETMKALEGRRAHLTHIQFHSYGGSLDDQDTFGSQVLPLVEYFNQNPNLTIDVGQVMFGETTSMTGDGPLGHYLHRVLGRKWFNADTELEAGCGIVPITYKDKSFVHALQWAIGLEWYLLAEDPWRIAMSTDHPNGAAFMAYPQIIALLMDRTYRQELFQRLPQRLRERCCLADLTREYTMREVAIVTRAAPARILGLTHKGHLGVGADADITVYTPSADRVRMFELPRYVFKAGELVVDQGEIRRVPYGPVLITQPQYDDAVLPSLRDWFERYATIQFANYPVSAEYLSHGAVPVECRPR